MSTLHEEPPTYPRFQPKILHETAWARAQSDPGVVVNRPQALLRRTTAQRVCRGLRPPARAAPLVDGSLSTCKARFEFDV
ncbi:hypothetical protein Sinac_1370 [Singulisphaera acidiphila DSM 18658]|uniref:Uncharacterized protein n=1 Tax=Singulisphaera acidiphila (strain ATCC BAA-1392 / DSM 18658 / VKM B-2454 / MOB10) TaxID=886293 RepID=L0D8M4_SINAD|nr:hypothetical protein Sinac_1370 [Singulisphaera acidiphila DSM 18658]